MSLCFDRGDPAHVGTARDDAPHDDAPHDDAPHDDAPHDDAPHVDATHDDATHDDAARRRLLWAMPQGLYVLGTTGGASGPHHLMTQSLVTQVATVPCVLGVAVEVAARSHALLEASGVATLCVLRRDQRALVRRFVKPTEDVVLDEAGRPTSIGGEPVGSAPSGAPFLLDALGCVDLVVRERVRFLSHSLFCCEVTGVAVAPEVLQGTASARVAQPLRMEDTKMNYGG